MPDFQFLRQTPPDVMRYLPQFLKKDEHFAKIQEALSMEHEKQRQAIIDIAKQFFVDTATWGLSSWERVYATNPPADADITLRRSLIKAKMLGAQTITKKNLENIVNQFTSNKKGYVCEDTGPGCLTVMLPGSIKYLQQLSVILNSVLPAHLNYNFHIIFNAGDMDAPNPQGTGGIDAYYGIVNMFDGIRELQHDFTDELNQNVNAGVKNIYVGSVSTGLYIECGSDIDLNCAAVSTVTNTKEIPAFADRSTKFANGASVTANVYVASMVTTHTKSETSKTRNVITEYDDQLNVNMYAVNVSAETGTKQLGLGISNVMNMDRYTTQLNIITGVKVIGTKRTEE